MGDELASPGNGRGVTRFSHGDGRDDVADVFEVHFGLEDADNIAGEALDGNGDGHIWF